MAGIDVWDRSMAHSHLNRVESTEEVQVCTLDEMNRLKKTRQILNDQKLSLSGVGDELINSGLSVLFHNVAGKHTLEVRGYDENMERFSYKFHYALRQPVMVRMISQFGDVNKVKISVDKDALGVSVTEVDPDGDDTRSES